MSKAKRGKSGNSSDTGNWETELVQAAFFEVIFLLILVIFCIQYGLYINRVSVSDSRFATCFWLFTNHFFKKNKENHKSKFADLITFFSFFNIGSSDKPDKLVFFLWCHSIQKTIDIFWNWIVLFRYVCHEFNNAYEYE